MSIIGAIPAPDPFYFMRIHSQWLLMALVAALAVAVFYLVRPILFAPDPEVAVTAARPVLPNLSNSIAGSARDLTFAGSSRGSPRPGAAGQRSHA